MGSEMCIRDRLYAREEIPFFKELLDLLFFESAAGLFVGSSSYIGLLSFEFGRNVRSRKTLNDQL
mgnify:CR=1 FL=1